MGKPVPAKNDSYTGKSKYDFHRGENLTFIIAQNRVYLSSSRKKNLKRLSVHKLSNEPLWSKVHLSQRSPTRAFEFQIGSDDDLWPLRVDLASMHLDCVRRSPLLSEELVRQM